MPYKSEKLTISNEKLDRRFKILEKDRKKIRQFYYSDGLSIRHIAKIYSKICSRRTIQFVLFPERKKRIVELHDWKKYYTKAKNREYQKKHRRYKYNLYKKGLIE